jgi:D-sedoheptulose 7-phosphate isomerase
MPVVGLTGSADSKLSEYLDRMQQIVLRAPSTETPIIQQCHLVIEHCICALVEQAMCE